MDRELYDDGRESSMKMKKKQMKKKKQVLDDGNIDS